MTIKTNLEHMREIQAVLRHLNVGNPRPHHRKNSIPGFNKAYPGRQADSLSESQSV